MVLKRRSYHGIYYIKQWYQNAYAGLWCVSGYKRRMQAMCTGRTGNWLSSD